MRIILKRAVALAAVPVLGAGMALAIMATSSSPAAASTPGEACVINAPSGATISYHGINVVQFGHVGWAYELPNGKWEGGANEGPLKAPLEYPEWFTSKTWYVEESSLAGILKVFGENWPGTGSQPGFYHAKGFYLTYDCAPVPHPDAAAALKVVASEQGQLYVIPGVYTLPGVSATLIAKSGDCESQVDLVLTAYGVTHLPGYFKDPAPNTWYDDLVEFGFTHYPSLSPPSAPKPSPSPSVPFYTIS